MNLLVSYNWLKEFVTIKQSPEKVAELLSLHALSAERLYFIAKQMDMMVIGKVMQTEKHANADKLSVNMVDVGGKTVQIVCGASNVCVGMLAAVALPGARVRWHGEGDLVTLEAAKIRGVESFGMMCASSEIGLEKYPDGGKGIMDLSWTDTKPGTPLVRALDMDDVLLDVEMTSNRPDAMSIVGVAREIAAVTGTKLRIPTSSQPSPIRRRRSPSPFRRGEGEVPMKIFVDIRAKKLCTRFAVVVINDVKVGPSPWWMQKRLLMAGLRPINNIVDITNYVMLEQGKPLHAFDADKITEEPKNQTAKELIVRTAEKGESIAALDGKTYVLNDSMLIVADKKRPLAIAGVMGGEESGVTAKTKTIILESAVFDPVSIRHTARALNLHSEASNLFEKGLSDESVLPALARAVELALQIAGGQVASKVVDQKVGKSEIKKIVLRSETIERMLGIQLSAKDVVRYLSVLGFEVKQKSLHASRFTFHVRVPWWRSNDVAIEEDLVEEIARLYGYHRLPAILPDGQLTVQDGEDKKIFFWERHAKEFLFGAGYTEVMSYSFVPKKWLELVGEAGSEVIAVANPLTADLAVMRTILVPSLLAVISENQERRGQLHLFELAATYRWDKNGKPEERPRLAIAVVRKHGEEQMAFREAKGITAAFLQSMGIPNTQVRMTQKPQNATQWKDVEQSVCIEINGVIRGYVGVVRASVAKEFGVDRAVVFATFKFEQLIPLATTMHPYTPLPKYPPVTRDLAFIVQKTVTYADIEAVLKKQSLIVSVELFDLYEGEKLGINKKSLAFHVAYQSPERTLTIAEVDLVQMAMIKELEKKFGAQFRDF